MYVNNNNNNNNILPTFRTGRTRYNSLLEIAIATNATISFNNGLIVLSDRSRLKAETDGATGTGTGNLDFDNANKTFSSSGYLRIGDEFIRYTGISSGAFTGISRGVLDTEVVNHADNAEILHIHHVIGNDRLLDENFGRILDVGRLYNVITDSERSVEIKDDASIAQYKRRRVFTLTLEGLTQHESPWKSHIFEKYLQNLKDLQKIHTLVLKPTNYLRANQIIGIHFAGLVWTLQIVNTTFNPDSTEIRARTV